MNASRFPDPRRVRSDVIAFGSDLRVETLREAYRHGIFPWPHEDWPLPWFSPRRRTIILFDEFHPGRTEKGDRRVTRGSQDSPRRHRPRPRRRLAAKKLPETCQSLSDNVRAG